MTSGLGRIAVPRHKRGVMFIFGVDPDLCEEDHQIHDVKATSTFNCIRQLYYKMYKHQSD